MKPRRRLGKKTRCADAEIRPFDLEELRQLLIDRQGRPITYGDVAKSLGHEWGLPIMGSLFGALTVLGEEDRSCGQPLLCALVVNKATRLPGPGFFEKFFPHAQTRSARAALHRAILNEISAPEPQELRRSPT